MKRKERLKEHCCCSLRNEMDSSRVAPVTVVHLLELGLKRRIQPVPLPALKVLHFLLHLMPVRAEML